MKVLKFLEERKLLEGVNQRNEEAFGKCYNLYAAKIFRHAYYRLGSKELAEDVAAEVFKKTWEYLIESENQIQNLKAFLYRTANNLIVDHYRSKEKQPILIDEKLERKLGDSGQDIANIDRKIELKRVLKAMEKINVEYKELLILRYIDGLNTKEIARLKGKTRNAIYVSIHRGLKELQKILGQRR